MWVLMRISTDSRQALTDPPSSSLPPLLTLTHVPVQSRGQHIQDKWFKLKCNSGGKKTQTFLPQISSHAVDHKGKASIKQRGRDAWSAISAERVAQTVQNKSLKCTSKKSNLGQGHVAWAGILETCLFAKSQHHMNWNMQITRHPAQDCAWDSHLSHRNLNTWL